MEVWRDMKKLKHLPTPLCQKKTLRLQYQVNLVLFNTIELLSNAFTSLQEMPKNKIAKKGGGQILLDTILELYQRFLLIRQLVLCHHLPATLNYRDTQVRADDLESIFAYLFNSHIFSGAVKCISRW